MKKFTAILLTVIMVASLFISCNDSIAPTVTDETVSVSFTEATSRSLTASLDPFEADDYYWAYKAVKKDNTGLISGQTNFAWIDKENTGLTKKVAGFSQGVWEFTLFAYTAEGKTNTSYSETGLAYTGTNSSVTLVKGGENKVTVRVNPVSQGNGNLVVDTARITMNIHQSGSLSNTQLEKFDKKVKVTNLSGNEEKYPVNGIYTLPAGAYKVTVWFENKENKLEYASGSVVATVYANMTTTVAGSLDEILTNADFETEINPDVMNRNVYSDAFNVSSNTNIIINKKGNIEDEKVSATVPKTVAQNILSNAITTNSIETDNTSNEMKLILSVDTTSTGVTDDGKSTIAYEIGLSSVLTSTNNTTSEVLQYSSPVTGTLDEYVVAEIKLQSGLADVLVTHNGNEMEKLTKVDADPSADNQHGAYYYNSGSGLLTIKTKSFSPFEVIYKAVSYIAEMGGVKYATIQDAINAAPGNAGESVSTITLLSSVGDGASFGFPDSMADSGRNICIDLNGYKYTFLNPGMGSKGTENQAMHLINGNTLKLKNGTISVSKDTTEIKRMIQSYCDLTLENVIVDCSNVISRYNNSICRGSLTVTGNTDLIASYDTAIIFDVDGTYGHNVSVVFDKNYTGTTSGVIEYVASNGDHTSVLTIKSGNFNGNITSSGNTKPSITGGTFSSDPSAYVAKGCEVKEDGEKYVVSLIIGAKKELNTVFPNGADVIDTQEKLNARLNSAAENKTNTLYIGEGTFNINNINCKGKTIEFVGSGYERTTLLYGTRPVSETGEQGSSYSFEGANVTFKDVTLQDGNGDDLDYKGFVRSNGLTFENCLLKSRMTYLGENGIVSFTNCTFNTPRYAAWIYSSQTYNFENCLFDSPTGRFLNIYSEANINPVINATKCKFIDTSDGTDSNAVFNIKFTANTTLTIQDCVVTGASPMYKVEKANGTTVIVDGKTVYGTAN